VIIIKKHNYMKKLESLKSKKFEAFDGKEILNPMSIFGGERIYTSKNGKPCDSYTFDTKTKGGTAVNGQACDFTHHA
jgi:hypothetical protein